jgi:SAM-dependent methyltransferase
VEHAPTKPDYDKLWHHQWGGMQDIGPVHRHAARILCELIRPLGGRSFADVGCGNGVNLEAIQSRIGFDEVAGFDTSETALAVCAMRVPRVDTQRIDLEYEQPKGEFDVVLCSQVIEHISDDEGFLRRLRAITKRYCIVTTVQGRMRRSEASVGHLRNYTRAGLELKMQQAGLRPLRAIEWGWPFYSPIYRSAIELFGGQDAKLTYGKRDRLLASGLYHVYRLNRSDKGDILTVLAEAA